MYGYSLADLPYLVFATGLVCAALGGNLFVTAIVQLAHRARVSPGMVGATVAAAATSMPEATVALNAAMLGHPEISFGDALGSNVANVGLILGLSLAAAAMVVPRDQAQRDFLFAALAVGLTALLMVDGWLSRLDGLLLLALFTVWLGMTSRAGHRQRRTMPSVRDDTSLGWVAILLGGGFAFLAAAGHLIVIGAGGIAGNLGLDPFIVGAIFVAVGTSIPELATTAVAALRGHGEIGVGTILGSNIFNGLFIVGLVSALAPIPIDLVDTAVTLGFGGLALAVAYPRDGRLTRRRGLVLLLLYGSFLVALVQRLPIG